jgi:hypothetical protein
MDKSNMLRTYCAPLARCLKPGQEFCSSCDIGFAMTPPPPQPSWRRRRRNTPAQAALDATSGSFQFAILSLWRGVILLQCH